MSAQNQLRLNADYVTINDVLVQHQVAGYKNNTETTEQPLRQVWRGVTASSKPKLATTPSSGSYLHALATVVIHVCSARSQLVLDTSMLPFLVID